MDVDAYDQWIVNVLWFVNKLKNNSNFIEIKLQKTVVDGYFIKSFQKIYFDSKKYASSIS